MAPPALRSSWSASRTRPARLNIPIAAALGALYFMLRFGAFPGPGDVPILGPIALEDPLAPSSSVPARNAVHSSMSARRRGELVVGRKRTVATFEEAVEKVIAVHRAGWKDDGRQEKLWRASLRDHAMPKLGRKPVGPDQHGGRDGGAASDLEREAGDGTAGAAASRRGDAVAQGYREDNPAGEAIGAALPKTGVRPQHHRALPFADVGGAIATVGASAAYRATVLAFEFRC